MAVAADGNDDVFCHPELNDSVCFVDVPADTWFSRDIASAYAYGLMKGVGKAKFNPAGDITVIETIAIACRINSRYCNAQENFVQGIPWYQVYADYAAAAGIRTADHADYNKPASRAEFSQIIASSLPEELWEAINTIEDNAIPDVPLTSAYADSVYRLYRAGILTGNNSGAFLPESSITRAEAAAVVSRIVEPSSRRSFTLKHTSMEGIFAYLQEESNRQKALDNALQLNDGQHNNACVYFISAVLRLNNTDIPLDICDTSGLVSQLKGRGWQTYFDYRELRLGDICFTMNSSDRSGTPSHTYVFMGWLAPDSYDFAMVCDNQADRYGAVYHQRNIAIIAIHKGEKKEAFQFFLRK